MFSGFPHEMFDFFVELSFNNHKAFFEENRARYERAVKAPMLALCERLAPTVADIDANLDTAPARALCRIRRDTRFSRDKSPYRTTSWLSFRPIGQKKGGALGFWFEIGPEGVSYGMGSYDPPAEMREGMRRAAAHQGTELAALVEAAARAGFALGGASYARLKVPDCVPPSLHALYLKKDFYFEQSYSLDARVHGAALAEEVARGYLALAPLYRFLRDLLPPV